MSNTADVTGGKPIANILHFISGVSAVNPFIINLLMSTLLEHRPSLWITHKENGP
jgi:hypothetical protein